MQELANYGHTDGNDSLTDSTVPWTSHPELFLDSLPELSDSDSLSEDEFDYGMEDYVPFLNVELGESFDMNTLCILLAEIDPSA
ncbi:unnamed protein product [Fusarium graminearum]|nr:unnamed protein product [Fusarium graminearum]